MNSRKFFLSAVLAVAAAAPLARAEAASRDQELFNQGKILIFDKKWADAREVFRRVISEFPKSPVVPQAYYYIARCFQFQGNEVEAIQSYEHFLQLYPGEPFLPAEARNAVVELSATLIERGNPEYRNRIIDALSNPDKDVRYFAAIRSSRLKDRHIASMAIPVLREIVRNEGEPELTDRARIALLRLDPKALGKPQVEAQADPPKRESKPASKASKERLFHVLVLQEGMAQPKVELSLPVSLAQLAIAALDESAKAEIRKKGIDIDHVWESLRNLGPTNILTFRDGPNTVKIWIE
jgi:tetratricopeptide (TPR) repeat protein